MMLMANTQSSINISLHTVGTISKLMHTVNPEKLHTLYKRFDISVTALLVFSSLHSRMAWTSTVLQVLQQHSGQGKPYGFLQLNVKMWASIKMARKRNHVPIGIEILPKKDRHSWRYLNKNSNLSFYIKLHFNSLIPFKGKILYAVEKQRGL